MSDDTIVFGTLKIDYLNDIKYIAYTILGLALVQATPAFNSSRSKKYTLLFLVLVYSTTTLTMLANHDASGGYFYQMAIALLAYLIASRTSLSKFVKQYNNIMFFVCCVSISLYFIWGNTNIIQDLFTSTENYAGESVINLYVASIFNEMATPRITGPFREPGVFMVYIIISILFELFLQKKTRLHFLCAFFYSIILTYSTGGYIVGAIIIFGYIQSLNRINQLTKFLIITLLVASFATFLFTTPTNLVFDKFSSDSSYYGNTLARMTSFYGNISISLLYPWFGAGLSQYSKLFTTNSLELYGVEFSSGGQSTNTWMAIFATYGLALGFCFIFRLYNFSSLFSRSGFLRVIVLISILLIFSTQDMRYSLLLYCLLFLPSDLVLEEPVSQITLTSNGPRF